MVNVCHYRPAGTTPDAPALGMFQKQWQLYRKVCLDAANFSAELFRRSLPGQDGPNSVAGSAALGLVRPTKSLVI